MTMIDGVIQHLDLTSFPNSVGKRLPGKSTFGDFGFSVTKKTATSAELIRRSDGHIKSFKILKVYPKTMTICFRDRFVLMSNTPSQISSNVTSAISVERSTRGLWKGREVIGGTLGCRNTTP